MALEDPGKLTDAQARTVVVRSLRNCRAKYRQADTAGEKFEREIDRLIKRKTRINSNSLSTLTRLYDQYVQSVGLIQYALAQANDASARF